MSTQGRLIAKLVRMPNGCLEWTGSTNAKSYGNIGVNGKIVYTHRLAWQLANGSIPSGLWVLHHCDNPPCCDVEHLFLGTAADNNADMAAKGRIRNGCTGKTHCKRGHEFTELNTYTQGGRRQCRTCRRAAGTARRSSVAS